jgi:hypothetical protein
MPTLHLALPKRSAFEISPRFGRPGSGGRPAFVEGHLPGFSAAVGSDSARRPRPWPDSAPGVAASPTGSARRSARPYFAYFAGRTRGARLQSMGADGLFGGIPSGGAVRRRRLDRTSPIGVRSAMETTSGPGGDARRPRCNIRSPSARPYLAYFAGRTRGARLQSMGADDHFGVIGRSPRGRKEPIRRNRQPLHRLHRLHRFHVARAGTKCKIWAAAIDSGRSDGTPGGRRRLDGVPYRPANSAIVDTVSVDLPRPRNRQTGGGKSPGVYDAPAVLHIGHIGHTKSTGRNLWSMGADGSIAAIGRPGLAFRQTQASFVGCDSRSARLSVRRIGHRGQTSGRAGRSGDRERLLNHCQRVTPPPGCPARTSLRGRRSGG